MSKYSKNFILCGEIDFYCLLCKESFEVADEVEKHIRWEQHRKLIKIQEYLPKFRKDGVYKIQDEYYCEVCNYLTSSLNSIKNHVKEEDHKAMKANPDSAKKESLVKRDFNFVVVSKIVMDKKEWHGVINSRCLFCKTAVNNFNSHKVLPGHIISLIQAKVKKDEDDHVYRKVNEDIYCFKCKKIYSSDVITDHWSSYEHTGKSKHENEGVKLLFEIDRENSTATCVVCNKTLIWSFVPMDEHRDKHIKKGEWIKDEKEVEQAFMQLLFQDKGKRRAQLKQYGKDNFIKMNEGGSKGFCSICNIEISAHIRNFKQHVNGVRHNSFLELKGLVKKTKKTEKANYKTKPFIQFVKEIIHVKSANRFLIPSAELCIDIMSFGLLAPINKRFVCFLCDGVYTNVKTHLQSGHTQKLFQTNVVTTLKGEFIREIRRGLFHCGVCNIAFAGWTVLEKHLKLFKHKYARSESCNMIEEIVDPSLINSQHDGDNAHDGIRGDDFLLD